MAQQRMVLSADFSGRGECLYSQHGAFRPVHTGSNGRARPQSERCNSQVQADSGKNFGDAVKNVARRVQGALPIVGLLSRLASSSGGIGRDELAYPEYARQLLDEADSDFNSAVSQWEERHGRVGQRRYVVLFLWMAFTGLGIVSEKVIANAASRLRVTHDITTEMERFELERENALSVYSYAERPKGKTRSQINIAVDALCRLSVGVKDGEPIPASDKELIVPIVSQAFREADGVSQLVADAVTDASREARKLTNK